MSSSKLVPKHLQDDPGSCLLIIDQAMRWSMSPFAVAQCTSAIGGKLMYEGKLVAAAVQGMGAIVGHFDYEYEGAGPTRKVKVSATRVGESAPRTITAEWKDVKTDNPFWTKQPDQQLAYAGTRIWARRWAPAAILGVYAPEEFDRKTGSFVDDPTIEHESAPAAPAPTPKTVPPKATVAAPSPRVQTTPKATTPVAQAAPIAQSPSDQESANLAPHPLDEDNGTKWLKNLRNMLDACTSEEQVVEIAGHPRVDGALEAAPPGIKEMIRDYLTDAYARFREAQPEAAADATKAEDVATQFDADEDADVQIFMANLKLLSKTEAEALDSNAAHRAWLKKLSEENYKRVCDAITDKVFVSMV